ncbi:MAG: ornithine cyclodeaminase family protein [Alphaproteobacteria bacterium]|nr:ornithine cyclodeaminase family protein [Alphaproteobacteria bacterium]
MRVVTAAEVDHLLDYPGLIEALGSMFREGWEAPPRAHHELAAAPDRGGGTLLLMPAWQPGGPIGVKLVTVFPDNAARGLASVQASYVLLDGTTGTTLAFIDGTALTLRRTAAASALAARFLARADAARLLMVGTGALAPHLVAAHAAVRPLRDIRIWGRDPAKAGALAEHLSGKGWPATAAGELADEAAQADVISCATLAREPLIAGRWLRPGTHLDLVGGFTPDMREADDEAIRRAAVFVDTRGGALTEAGDIVQPIRSGALTPERIAGDLFDLLRGTAPGRRAADEITVFKSVGTALEDLAAARLLIARLGG